MNEQEDLYLIMKKILIVFALLIVILKSNGQSAEIYLEKGNENYKSSDFNEAIKNYNKAIELNPKITEAYWARGSAKAYLKNYRGAIADFNKAIELNPKYTQAYWADRKSTRLNSSHR